MTDLIHAEFRTYKVSWKCPICYIDCANDPVRLQAHLTGGHSKEDLERYIFWEHINN